MLIIWIPRNVCESEWERETQRTLRRRKKYREFDNIEIPCVRIFFPSQSGEHAYQMKQNVFSYITLEITYLCFARLTRMLWILKAFQISGACILLEAAQIALDILNRFTCVYICEGSDFNSWDFFSDLFIFSFCIRWATADEILMASVFFLRLFRIKSTVFRLFSRIERTLKLHWMAEFVIYDSNIFASSGENRRNKVV